MPHSQPPRGRLHQQFPRHQPGEWGKRARLSKANTARAGGDGHTWFVLAAAGEAGLGRGLLPQYHKGPKSQGSSSRTWRKAQGMVMGSYSLGRPLWSLGRGFQSHRCSVHGLSLQLVTCALQSFCSFSELG